MRCVPGREGAGRAVVPEHVGFSSLYKRVSYGSGVPERRGTGKYVEGGEALNDDHQAAA